MKKIEKLLITPIFWLYVGPLVGLILGVLFGGRGGMFFVALGFIGGCAVAVIRTIYLGFNYDENLECPKTSNKRTIGRRIVFSAMYFVLIYSMIF